MRGREIADRRAATPRPGATVFMMAIPDEPSDSDAAVLTADELHRANRFRFAKDRTAYVTVRAAARRHLAREIGALPQHVPIVSDVHGRPGLGDGLASDLDFNVSHTDARAAVAVARGRRIGVDLERQRTDRGLRTLVADVMGPREREMLDGLQGPEFVRAFYACWTRKEAIVKGMGVGISYPLRTIDLPQLPPGGVVRVAAAADDGAVESWTLHTMPMGDEFTLSVALAGVGGAISVVES